MQTPNPGSAPAADAPPPETVAPTPAEPSAEFLHKELDLLYSLYAQTDASLQNVFNYYTALLTAISGAIVVVVQIMAGSADPIQAQLAICGLLTLLALIGSIYLSSISGKYAHLARYASSIDELRRHLLGRWQVETPPLYARFLAEQSVPPRGASLRYLLPAGTYGFFLGLINTVAIGAAMLLFLSTQGVALQQSLLPVLLLCLLVNTIYNIYSHMVIAAISTRLNVHLSTHSVLPFLAGRQ